MLSKEHAIKPECSVKSSHVQGYFKVFALNDTKTSELITFQANIF